MNKNIFFILVIFISIVSFAQIDPILENTTEHKNDSKPSANKKSIDPNDELFLNENRPIKSESKSIKNDDADFNDKSDDESFDSEVHFIKPHRRNHYNGIIISGFGASLMANTVDKLGTRTDNSHIDQSYGAAVGYISLNRKAVGWSAQFNLLQNTKSESISITDTTNSNAPSASTYKIKTLMYFIDFNANYLLNNYTYIFAGANYSYIAKVENEINSTDNLKYSPDFGFQTGIGFKLLNHINLELMYVQFNQKSNTKDSTSSDNLILLREEGPSIHFVIKI